MTTYHVTAWCNYPHYTTFEVEARSFAAALKKARAQAREEYAEPCEGAAIEWNEFQIHAENRKSKRRVYFEPARRAEMAAQEMLEALLLCEEVLSDLARLDDGTPSVTALIMAREAIVKATAQQERAP